MALETSELVRAFKYNSVELPDPGSQFTVEQVKDFFAATYPEIVNATIEGPEQKDDKQVYTFRRAVGTKGAKPDLPDLGIDGAALIGFERSRQVNEEGYDTGHDDGHTDHSLALAACAYAAPEPLFVYRGGPRMHSFGDVWPLSWDSDYDKRPRDSDGPLIAELVDPAARIRCLVKAGALIAAEIDRLRRTAK
jgi:PRTRC genetic system protein C